MTDFWKKKLAARLHDPAEKALVLMRDDVGHEQGSVQALREAMGIDKGLFDKRADWFAASADRPQWPGPADERYPGWANVRFADRPVLIHPLSGEQVSLRPLYDVAAQHIRAASLDHFRDLIEKLPDGSIDYRLSLLAFWRFGGEPKLAAPDIGELWRLLPADTRVPDHSIWSHLDIVSALAGAMADGGEPALLAMSFGPVQSFIAQARSTSDLWAGSHLLSSLVWEGLATICGELGPDAVLFPALRGVAAVDRWLLAQARLAGRHEAWTGRFEEIGAEWVRKATDENPLFAATLPNKFVAIVPAARAKELALRVEQQAGEAALRLAEAAAERIFGEAEGAGEYWRTQLRDQLAGFPQVHWSAVRWPVPEKGENRLPEDWTSVKDALAEFGTEGLFGEAVWNVLSRKIDLEADAVRFFQPNAGMLYPAVHDLVERALAAAKSERQFDQLLQNGYRCTLCGEREWLARDVAQLGLSREARKSVSAWGKLTGRFGIKDGEHLCGVCSLKRLWPSLFVDQLEDLLGDKPARFVVSTHAMSLATSFGELLKSMTGDVQAKLAALHPLVKDDFRVALPASLARALHSRTVDRMSADVIRRLPSALDRLRDSSRPGDEDALRELERQLEDLLGHRPETYYALIQMDGDRMGAWLAGNEQDYQLKFPETWHPSVRSALDPFRDNADVGDYLESHRPASPARHAAISQSLNDFSTHVAGHIVEVIFKGKLIYSGGDDLLAMVAVDDLLLAMMLLRAAYSGIGDTTGLPRRIDLKGLELGKGWVLVKDRLMLMMGHKATASIGAVVAHHQAPLAAVLRQLREAQARAKAHGRDAFAIRLMKRGGGEVGVTAKFREKADASTELGLTALGLLMRFADALAQPGMSRRAVYRAAEWLSGLPPRGTMPDPAWEAMVACNLEYQFKQQGGRAEHAGELVRLAMRESRIADSTQQVLESLLVTAEFFAREGRSFGHGDGAA